MLVHRGGRISRVPPSSQVAFDSDQAHFTAAEGPCLEAIREHPTVMIADLRHDEAVADVPRSRPEARREFRLTLPIAPSEEPAPAA